MPDISDLPKYRNPSLSTDIIIRLVDHEILENIVLIERRNPPYGWAIPGGFVDYGESVEHAAVREAFEETGLHVDLRGLLYVYSDPKRDPRQHVASAVFFAVASGRPVAGDDAKSVKVVDIWTGVPDLICDHGRVVADYRNWLTYGRYPDPSLRL